MKRFMAFLLMATLLLSACTKGGGDESTVPSTDSTVFIESADSSVSTQEVVSAEKSEDGEELVNLAKGKKYYFTDDPTDVDRPLLYYGESDGDKESFSDRDCTRLTDGVVGDYSADCYKTDPYAMAGVTVMIVGTNRNVEFIVDLGEVHDGIEELVIRGIRNGIDNGNSRNFNLKMVFIGDKETPDEEYTKANGTKSQSLVENAPDIPSGDGSSVNKEHYDYKFTFDSPVSARYVRLLVDGGGGYIRQLEEIEIWGKAQ